MTQEQQPKYRRRPRPRHGRSAPKTNARRRGAGDSRPLSASAGSWILIGMPGCGKSTVGRRLAQQLGLPFVDTDAVLLEQTGLTTGELSASTDRAGFLEAETRAVCSVRPVSPTVIATGGSVVYSRRAMWHLQQIGTVIYLDVPLPVLRQRLGDLQRRGVVLKPEQTLADLYQERTRLYRRYADLYFKPRRLTLGKSANLLSVICRFMTEPLPTGESKPASGPLAAAEPEQESDPLPVGESVPGQPYHHPAVISS